MKTQKQLKKIFTQKLEGIGAGIFQQKYKDLLIKEIGTKHGVYALYDKRGKLYYVGRASKITRRLKHHFKDRHTGKWDRFSIYLTKKEQYIYGIEDALISIAQPKGNIRKPLRIDNKMKSRIKKAMEKIDAEQREKIIDGKILLNRRKNLMKIRNEKKSEKIKKRASLNNPFKTRKVLRKIYKGKPYKAIWLPSGWIEYKNKKYSSLTSAAKIASGRKIINGKAFWRVQDNKGNWIRIKDCI